MEPRSFNDVDSKQDFYEVVKRISETNTSDLIKNTGNKTGVIEYTEILGSVEEIKYYLSYVTIERLNGFPDIRFHKLKSLLMPLFNALQQIKYQVKNTGLADNAQKVGVLNQFKSEYESNQTKKKEQIWSLIQEMILLENTRKVNEPKSNLEAKLQEELTKAATINNQLQAVLNAAQTDLGKQGIEKHAKLFHDQAKEHEEKANNWRLSAIFLGILTIFVLYHMVSYVIGKQSGIDRIQATVVSIAIISLFSYGIAISIKNFFAEKHNQAINEHRGNCLGSVELFAQSADKDVKQAILLQATNTIFSYQKTGFLRKDSDQLNPNPMFEIFKKITEGNSGA